VSIRLEAAIALAKAILDGKSDYMHHSEEMYKIIAWRIVLAVQKDERAQFKQMSMLINEREEAGEDGACQ
jgi:hypothetical protein